MKKINAYTPLGYKITLIEFMPKVKPKDSVIIVPATGVKQVVYTKFSDFLRSHNYAVYTFDYGGIGESKKTSLKRFNTSATNWAKNDLETVIQYVKKKQSSNNLFLIGHSIGGQLIGIADSSKSADGIILVSAQTGYWKFWKGVEKIKMYIIWYFLIPFLQKYSDIFHAKN